MKNLLVILSIICFALPCFCADGYREDCGFKTYDDNGTQEYAQELEKEYWERVNRGECNISGKSYNRYVRLPVFKHIEKYPAKYNN